MRLPIPRRLTASLLALGVAALPAAAQTRVPAPASDTLRLSIGDAVTRALRNADAVRIAETQLDITDAQEGIALSSGLPQLRLSGAYTHVFESARGAAVGRFFSQPNTYTFSGTLSQTLFQGGRVFSATRAASRLRSAAKLTAEETRAQTSVDAQRAYLGALLAQRVAELQASNLELSAQRVAQVERLQGAGRAARYDVLRARVEQANLEPVAVQAESDRDIALLELKRLLGIPLQQPVELTSQLDVDGVQATLASLAADSADMGEERGSVRAAELTARASHDAIRVAQADLLPSISVFATGGYSAFPVNGFPPGMGRTWPVSGPCAGDSTRTCSTTQQNGGWFRDLSAGVQVSWSLFDGLRTRANIDLAQANAQLAQLRLQQERKAVALEVAQARADLARARTVYMAQQQTAGEAQEAFQLASLRFSRGLSTQLEVSDAQLAQLTAQINEARAAYDLYLSAAELARALGRPVPLPPVKSAPVRTTSISTPTTNSTSASSTQH